MGISQRLFYTLIAVLSGYPKPLRAFPSGYQLKHSNFHPFYLKGRVSVNVYEKSKEHFKILKTTSGSFPVIYLSSNTVFSQSKSHASVPLRAFGVFYCHQSVGLIIPLLQGRGLRFKVILTSQHFDYIVNQSICRVYPKNLA